MRNIRTDIRQIVAIFIKQLKDTKQNKTVLFQFILLPVLALITSYVMPKEVSQQSLVPTFTTMYISMIPISCMCSVIAEEREKGTLLSLRMAGVSGGQYLLGIGGCLFIECFFGVILLSPLGEYNVKELAQYLVISSVGILASLLIGATIGLITKNQMSATACSAPVSVIFSFVPTLASMNEKIAQFSKYLYTQQLNNLFQKIGQTAFEQRNIVILGANIFMFCVLFILIYRKKGLQDGM